MAKAKKSAEQQERFPATTPEARESEMIALAVDLAEKQLRDGSASSSVITHYLKLGSTRERLEQELLEQNVELKGAQTESLRSSQRMEELYANAIQAIMSYNGQEADGYDVD